MNKQDLKTIKNIKIKKTIVSLTLVLGMFLIISSCTQKKSHKMKSGTLYKTLSIFSFLNSCAPTEGAWNIFGFGKENKKIKMSKDKICEGLTEPWDEYSQELFKCQKYDNHDDENTKCFNTFMKEINQDIDFQITYNKKDRIYTHSLFCAMILSGSKCKDLLEDLYATIKTNNDEGILNIFCRNGFYNDGELKKSSNLVDYYLNNNFDWDSKKNDMINWSISKTNDILPEDLNKLIKKNIFHEELIKYLETKEDLNEFKKKLWFQIIPKREKSELEKQYISEVESNFNFDAIFNFIIENPELSYIDHLEPKIINYVSSIAHNQTIEKLIEKIKNFKLKQKTEYNKSEGKKHRKAIDALVFYKELAEILGNITNIEILIKKDNIIKNDFENIKDLSILSETEFYKYTISFRYISNQIKWISRYFRRKYEKIENEIENEKKNFKNSQDYINFLKTNKNPWNQLGLTKYLKILSNIDCYNLESYYKNKCFALLNEVVNENIQKFKKYYPTKIQLKSFNLKKIEYNNKYVKFNPTLRCMFNYFNPDNEEGSDFFYALKNDCMGLIKNSKKNCFELIDGIEKDEFEDKFVKDQHSEL